MLVLKPRRLKSIGSQLTPTAMPGSQKKIGGEFGEVRANIDVDSLHSYLEKHVQRIALPVGVKQFKVSVQWFHTLGVLLLTRRT